MRHLLVACLVTEATNTLSEFVILVAFLQQQWIHKHTSVLYFMYTAHLVSDVLPVCSSGNIVYTAASRRAGCQRNHFICGKYEEIICSPMLAVHPTSLCFSGYQPLIPSGTEVKKKGAVLPLPYMPSYHAQG